MPRERSTWNVNAIAKRAGLKVADPYLMNQDHVNQQPAADAYTIGGPSDFAEDVHPSNATWEAEYSGGQVRRNEIGMPEMRSDTFNHPEKTASAEVITKKAALCVAISRSILPKTASLAEIEDQSFSFMHLPDAELMATYTRFAADQEQQEGQQQVQASQQQDQQQGQQVQAGQIPPQFLENVKKKKEEAEEKKDEAKDKKAAQDQQDQDQAQQKQAQQDQGQQDQAQQKQAQQDQGQQDQGQAQQKQAGMQQQIAQLLQQAQQLQQQLAQSQQQPQVAQAQVQQPVAQMQQQSQAQQIAQAVQQAIAQGQDPVQAAQQCMGQSQQQATSEIDQMLAEQGQIEPMADMDIQLDTPSMDTGEVQLAPGEDDTLRQLFANNLEYKNAQEAAGQGPEDQGQAQQKQAHVSRTASMRTVGTRPTAGVSQIGGVSSNAGAASGRDLSSIWNSAPDVRGAFGMRTDQ